jgi:hypothetical protein
MATTASRDSGVFWNPCRVGKTLSAIIRNRQDFGSSRSTQFSRLAQRLTADFTNGILRKNLIDKVSIS